MENLFWALITGDDRHEAIETIKAILARFGDIVDFNRFSDLALSMKIEIREVNLEALHSELSRLFSISGFSAPPSPSNRERSLFLNITFSEGTGALSLATPAVPG